MAGLRSNFPVVAVLAVLLAIPAVASAPAQEVRPPPPVPALPVGPPPILVRPLAPRLPAVFPPRFLFGLPDDVPPLAPLPFAPAPFAPRAENAADPEWSAAVRGGDANRAKQLLAAQPALAFDSDPSGRSWLHVAAELGHENVVAALLEAGVPVNPRTLVPGETPLHLAAAKGRAGVVQRLLAAGGAVDAPSHTGHTPLALAVRPGRFGTGIEYPGTAPAPNRAGRPPAGLRINSFFPQPPSALAARVETIRLLCLHGANIFAGNRETNFTHSPFQIVAVPGRENWLDLVLTNARPHTVRDPDGRSLLDLARHHERWDALLALALTPPQTPAASTNAPATLTPLQAVVFHSPPGATNLDGTRVEPPTYWNLLGTGQTPDLFTRIGLEDFSGVNAWLQKNPGELARVRDPEGRSPLHWAYAKGFDTMAALLLEHGADPAAKSPHDNSLLLAVIERGQLALLQKMPAQVAAGLRDDTLPVGLLEFALLKHRDEITAWLLERQPNVQRPSLTGGTLLHLAARNNSAPLVEKFLALGLDPKLPDHRRRTPLHLAAASGNEASVAALLHAGARLDARDDTERLPLHEAARFGKTALLAKLLPPAALLHQPDKSGRTALELATLGGHDAAAEFLLKQHPDLQRRGPGGTNLLQLAVLSTRPEIVTRLLTAGADATAADDRGRTPLHEAAELGLTNVLTQLLAAHALTTARDRAGRLPLDLAIAAHEASAIDLLVRRHAWNAGPTAGLTTPLHTAAAAGNVAMIAKIAAHYSTPDVLDEFGQTPLVVAANSNRFDLVLAFAKIGANINATNPSGQTPLLLALAREDFSAAQTLLSLQADVNSRDTNGNTALHLACQKPSGDRAPSEWLPAYERLKKANQIKPDTSFTAWLRTTNTLAALAPALAAQRLVGDALETHRLALSAEPWKFILAAGANAKATNHLGKTPLHHFAAQPAFYAFTHTSRVEVIVAELTRRGADLNASDVDGNTALHDAARLGRLPIVQALLQHGANPNARTRDGLTAVPLVLQAPLSSETAPDILATLAQHGADFNLRDTNGQTVLHHLARFGPPGNSQFANEVIAEILQAVPDCNAQDKHGDTPLHLALRHGRHALAQRLQAHGANSLLRNRAGELPLLMALTVPATNGPRAELLPPGARTNQFAAAKLGDLASLEAWRAAFPESIHHSNNVRQTPLALAALHRRTNAVEYLLRHGARPNAFVAVHLGRVAMLDAALRDDPTAATNRWHNGLYAAPLLHHAVAAGNAEILDRLLAQPLDVNATDQGGFTALYHALTNRPPQLADRLRAAATSENVFDLLARNQIEPLKLLVATNRAALSQRRTAGTPLVAAIEMTNHAAVNVLLDAGADPNEIWPQPFTMNPSEVTTNVARLLHTAVQIADLALTRTLLKHSANVNACDGAGRAPLHFAAWQGHTELLQLLLAHGADPNAQMPSPPNTNPSAFYDIPSYTPLHFAVQFGHTNSIRLLVAAGAKFDRTNTYALTFFDLARGGSDLRMPPGLAHFGPPAPFTFTQQFRSAPLPPRAPASDVINLLRSLGAKETYSKPASGIPVPQFVTPKNPPPIPPRTGRAIIL